jgi:hypothetical protein
VETPENMPAASAVNSAFRETKYAALKGRFVSCAFGATGRMLAGNTKKNPQKERE